jgi:hypothetical protein
VGVLEFGRQDMFFESGFVGFERKIRILDVIT